MPNKETISIKEIPSCNSVWGLQKKNSNYNSLQLDFTEKAHMVDFVYYIEPHYNGTRLKLKRSPSLYDIL